MSNNPNHLYHQQFTSATTKRFDDIVKYVQPRTYQDEDFQNEFKFTIEEVHTIKKTYDKFAYKQDLMDKRRFRNSLGILAMDNACFLADRLFDLMDVDRDGIVRFFDFISYLDVIMNRDPYKKAEMSFKFIDRDSKGKIVYEDIEYLITKIALFWKELTGQTVVPQRQHIDEIFGALDPKNTGEVRLSDFQKMYYNQDCYFQWFEFFNQDELTENKIAKIENNEIIKQKDQLIRMEIETNLKNVEQEITELIVQLNKVSKKYKEMLEIEQKQRMIQQLKLHQRRLIKLNQVQQVKNDISQQQSLRNRTSTTSANQVNLDSQRSKMRQTPVQSPFATGNEEERNKLISIKNAENNKKNTFELVLHSTTQNQLPLQQQPSLQNQSISQDKRGSLAKKNGENPAEFASSSSSSSVAVLAKKIAQKHITDPLIQNNNKMHPSIDFSTMSTLNMNFVGKFQQPSSNGRISIFNQTDNAIDQNKPKSNIFQPLDFMQEMATKRNQPEQNSYRNNNNNNIINPSSKRTSGSQFDQSSYYELNNYTNTQQRQQQLFKEEKQTTVIPISIFSCGFQDIFEKKQFESHPQVEEDTESKKSKRRYKIFDTTPVQTLRIQDEIIKFPSQSQTQKQQVQQQVEQSADIKQEKKISTTINNNINNNNNNNNNNNSNNNNISSNIQNNQNHFNQSNYNLVNNNVNTKQDKEKITPNANQNQVQDFQTNRSPLLLQAINKNQQKNINVISLSPISNQFKSNIKKSSISLHFGSLSDISLISGDIYNQPPVLNDVNGPLKLNLPTEQNLGDNDPETEDDTDCNNNRSYLEQKFQMLNNQSSMNTNGSPKRNKSSFDPKASPISGASSQTDMLSNQIRKKKKSELIQHKKKPKSPPTGNHKFKLEQSYDEANQLDELKQPFSREDSQATEEDIDEEDYFKSNQEIISTSKAVEFICEEYKKIETQIQEYVQLISQYQKQLQELDEMIAKSNSKKKDETRLPLKRQGALVNGQSSFPAIIDEESYSPSMTSNHMLSTKKEKASLNMIQFSNSNYSHTNNNIPGSSGHFNQPSGFKITLKETSHENLYPFPPSRYHTFSPQVVNMGSGNGLIHKKSLGQNENSSENINVQSLRKSTIKNMPALLNDKESKKQNTGKHRNLQLYIGHDNWNLVLEMMLVIRSAIKSLKKINHPALQNHGILGTAGSSLNTEGNFNNILNQQYNNFSNYQQPPLQNQSSIFYNQNNFYNQPPHSLSQLHQVSQFHPSNNINNFNIFTPTNNQPNSNPQQSTFSYLDNQFNPQVSAVLPDKKTLSNFGNISGIYGGNMAITGLPLEIKTKDFETHNQQLLFNTVSSSNYHFAQLEYIDYSPLVFESLRRYQNISQERFLRSLGPENLIGNLIMGRMSQISELCRSSTVPYKKFQYYSECGSFIVKTIPEVNAQYFLKILPNYYQYMMTQPNSLVLRIYGLYKLQIRQDKSSKKRNTNNQQDLENSLDVSGAIGNNDGGSNHNKLNTVYFMVCQNVFNTNLEIKHRFEIKGSTRGRKAVKKNTPQPNQTLPKKDLDWIDSNIRIRIDLQLKQQILNQLCSDAQFLSANKLLNYCALIGVHNFERQEDMQAYGKWDNNRSNYSSGSQVGCYNTNNNDVHNQTLESPFSKIMSYDRKSMYYLGIINIFTEYTTSKKWIAMLKNPFLGKTQSTVDPVTYSNRLLEFFQQRIFD